MDSLHNIDFKKLASQQKSIQMKMRLLALAHFKEGHSRTQIAHFLKVSRTSVNANSQTKCNKVTHRSGTDRITVLTLSETLLHEGKTFDSA